MKKYCEKCGLRHEFGREKTDQFVCKECDHANVSRHLQILAEKTSRYEICEKCGLVIHGITHRKKDDITTIEYECFNCYNEWFIKWKKISVKDRLKNIKKR